MFHITILNCGWCNGNPRCVQILRSTWTALRLRYHKQSWIFRSTAYSPEPVELKQRRSLCRWAHVQRQHLPTKTRQLICSERDRMYMAIQNMPAFKAYKPYANFILVRILKESLTSFDIFEAAIKERMMIRDCSSFKSLDGEYIRFCIMNPEDNTHLLKLLEQF